MIIEYLMKMGTENNEDYEKKVMKRLKASYGVGVLGILTIVFALIFKNYIANDFLRGFYSGIGFGLIAAALSIGRRLKKLLNDKVKLQEKKIEENDERNIFIITRTAYLSFIVSLIVIYLAFIVSGLFNLTVFLTLFVIIIFMILTLILVYTFLKRKY